MNKDVEYYMNLPYRLEIVPDVEEGGYVGRFPELPGCITVAETVEELYENAMDAKRAWIEAALEDGYEIAEPDVLNEVSGQFKIRIPKSLHRSLQLHAKEEGISMNQYCVYLLSQNDTRYLYSGHKARA